MFVRIVKMTFKPEKIDMFLEIFDLNKEKIRNTKGCNLLELYRDKQHTDVFFTYSYWNTEDDLENYRNSELFKDVWSRTKLLFHSKAQAWSVEKIHSLI